MGFRLTVTELLEFELLMGSLAFTLGWTLAGAVHRYSWGFLSICDAASGRPVSTLTHDLVRILDALVHALGTLLRSLSGWRWRL